MSGNVDLALLRQLVGVVATLPDHYTHRRLGEACECPGLPGPPGEDGNSERERVDGSFAASATSSWPAPPSWPATPRDSRYRQDSSPPWPAARPPASFPGPSMSAPPWPPSWAAAASRTLRPWRSRWCPRPASREPRRRAGPAPTRRRPGPGRAPAEGPALRGWCGQAASPLRLNAVDSCGGGGPRSLPWW